MKFLRFLLFLIPCVSANEIYCNFGNVRSSVNAKIYYCILHQDPSITLPNSVITKANGTHQPSKSHADVQGFYSTSSSKIIHYISHGLSKIFPNLIAIDIGNGRIKEIHQNDFEEYPNLKQLDSYNNDIKYLEKNLFKFNT
ncbi:hypothetical protein PVAND_003154 [Polypedilum vanderplanki]|uniref:Uncharacterized protein n=1 Tax=Polypedilum vanderplanki TaxID=319348 RepID=A0A9J6BT75_POLVA|nr:hypothetical protein PVAND_003154 [Polypedilum vanderplanki]